MNTDYKHIAPGHAYVRLVEATDVLLASILTARDRHAMEQARELAKGNLRELVATLPPHITAQILAASENIGGLIGDATKN